MYNDWTIKNNLVPLQLHKQSLDCNLDITKVVVHIVNIFYYSRKS